MKEGWIWITLIVVVAALLLGFIGIPAFSAFTSGNGGGGGVEIGRTVCASDCCNCTGCDYTCDGTADQVQINAAIDALATCGGGLVQLTDGTFTCSASIVIKDYITLQGVGDSTELTFAADVANGIGLIQDSCTDGHVTLRNFQIDGNGANQAVGDQSGIQLTDVDDSLIEGLYIHNVTQHGIYVTNMDDSTIQTNRIKAMADSGAYLHGCNRVSFKDNLIDGTGYPEFGTQHGAFFTTSDYCALSGNIVTNLVNNGLYFENGCDHNSLVRNIVKNVTIGCYFYAGFLGADCNYNELALNLIEGCSAQAIYFISDVNYGTITGNHVYDCGSGITVYGFFGDADYNLITNNNVVDLSGGYGLYIAANSVKNMVEGNILCAGRGANDYTDAGTNTRFIDNCGGAACDWLADDEDASPSLPNPTENYDLRVVGESVELATHKIEYSGLDFSNDAITQKLILEVVGRYGIDSIGGDSFTLTLYEGQNPGEALKYMRNLGFGTGRVTPCLVVGSEGWINAGLRARKQIEALDGRMPGRGIALWYMENPDAIPWTFDEIKELMQDLLEVTP